MADSIAINVKVVDNEVGPKLRKVQAAIASTVNQMKKFGTPGAGAANAAALDRLKHDLLSTVSASRGVAVGLAEGGRAAEKFRESLHFLHPLLATAGLELGNMWAFSVLAGAGLGVLGAALAGTILIGLAKLGDQSIVLKKRLGDVFQSPKAGGDGFGDLQERAKALGTDVATLAGPLERLQNAARASSIVRFAPGSAGAEQAAKRQAAALTSLYEAMRTGGATDEEAAKGLDQFTLALQRQADEGKKVQVTAQMVQQLAQVAPGAANALAQAFNRHDATAFAQSLRTVPVSLDQVVAALARIGPAQEAAFKTQAPKTFSSSLDQLITGFKETVKDLSGDDLSTFMAKQLDGVRQGIKSTKEEFEALGKAWDVVKNLFGGGTPGRGGYTPEQSSAFTAATGASPDSGVPFAVPDAVPEDRSDRARRNFGKCCLRGEASSPGRGDLISRGDGAAGRRLTAKLTRPRC
jgi:hypothetical protein